MLLTSYVLSYYLIEPGIRYKTPWQKTKDFITHNKSSSQKFISVCVGSYVPCKPQGNVKGPPKCLHTHYSLFSEETAELGGFIAFIGSKTSPLFGCVEVMDILSPLSCLGRNNLGEEQSGLKFLYPAKTCKAPEVSQKNHTF
jgi:hypothetical protein